MSGWAETGSGGSVTDWTTRFAACAVALDRLETELTTLHLAGVDVDDALDALITARTHLGAGLTDAAVAVRKGEER